MPDEVVPTNVSFEPAEEVENTQEVETTQEQPKGGNPAWQSLREKLDPISFKNIEDDLKGFDRSAQQRIEATNKAYEPWKQFADQGLTPEQLGLAYQVSQQLEADPEGVYQFLEGFLRDNGRLPSAQEVKAADDAGELEPQADPRIDQLAAQQQQITEFLAAQEQQQLVAQAESDLDTEMEALKQAHPDLSPADIKEVIQRAAFAAQSTGKIPTLEEAFGEFDELRNRIRSIPRPGDSAPRLPSPGGGIPSGAPQKKLGELSRAEVQDNFTQYLQGNK